MNMGPHLFGEGLPLPTQKPVGTSWAKEAPREKRDRDRLIAAMDAVNGRFGKGTLNVGSTALPGAT